MTYEIKLEVFEGPLDLLLHLIQRNEVSITDIPIALITGQYLETIELMKSLNLDVAGEYLVMAAYLTHIKSMMLLPHPEDDELPEQGEDPRHELVAHLLEYKRYKEAAENLAQNPVLDRDVFVRESLNEEAEIPLSQQPLNVGLPELLEAFREVIERTPRRDLIEVEPDRLLVKDKIREILEKLESHELITFATLFDEDVTRLNILTTFLALLEIVKLQLVRVYQDKPFGTILISRRVPLKDSQITDIEAAATPET
ncbi:MAG: segregation/condensation protein A [Deltaproteobacteria bacterium]|nr:segregation/condensation protein A [Deltaproteobacteria bacterium]